MQTDVRTENTDVREVGFHPPFYFVTDEEAKSGFVPGRTLKFTISKAADLNKLVQGGQI